MGHEWEQEGVRKGGPGARVRTQNGPGEASESGSEEAEICKALDVFEGDFGDPELPISPSRHPPKTWARLQYYPSSMWLEMVD